MNARDWACYECDTDLVGPFCPACNPEMITPAVRDAPRMDIAKFRKKIATVELPVVVTRYGKPRFIAMLYKDGA